VRYDTVIICINADMLPTFMDHDHGAGFVEGRYAIGFWFWELADFPDNLLPALDHLDEVWVTSDFTADVIRAHTSKPVRTVPLPVHAPARTAVTIPELEGDPAFTFLFTFDYLSVFERKNPLGLVTAFEKAFPLPGEARLVIKSVNGDLRPLERERLRYAARSRDDIVLMERYLSREELDHLLWLADCYVSLHRSEGFGLGLAESMAIGKPVIGTGYSGNMTFMTPQNSRPVDYKLVKVPEGCEPYPTTSRWAAPRTGQAARLMRRIFEEPELRARLGGRAARSMQSRHTLNSLAAFALDRLAELDASRPDRADRAGAGGRLSRGPERARGEGAG
jgi:glycosyltransferase involved in cell wall biosynthesis